MKRYYKSVLACLALVLASSCATYYQSNIAFNEGFERGDLKSSLKTLREKPSEGAGKKQFLYFANNGLLLSLLGEYQESNQYFEKAYEFGEDYRINYVNEAATYLTNPNFAVYRGEDHEHLLLLYYKAMNYLKLHKTDDALVECRRLNIRLQQLSDRYSSEDKYRTDAFIHTLMGIIYEADSDYNNAFIAYRNAVEVYDQDFMRLFQVGAPEQLKKDLLRAAFHSGLDDEFEHYKTQFGMTDYVVQENPGGELVFFWHNGLGPIKTEWSVEFAISERGGQVFFSNENLGVNYAFSSSDYSSSQIKSLTNMQVYRLTLPKYVDRPVYYTNGVLTTSGVSRPVQLLEDVSKVAFKCLDERMNLELSKALIRLAVKKASEQQIRKKDYRFGALMGIVNAITEKADTRNWQTLPHNIYYARIPLDVGTSQVNFQTTDYQGRQQEQTFTYDVKKGETHFHTLTSLESLRNYGGYN